MKSQKSPCAPVNATPKTGTASKRATSPSVKKAKRHPLR